MKTTIDIADPLLREAKKLAAREGMTLRALVEQGLRREMGERRKGKPFQLRIVTFKGDGMHPDIEAGGWEKIRELAYGGRGG